jgi:hypothetical protein
LAELGANSRGEVLSDRAAGGMPAAVLSFVPMLFDPTREKHRARQVA